MKLDPIVERACTWSLNTIIWSYHSAVIIQTGIKEEGRKFQSKELKKLLDHISKGHIPYQQSLLTYLVYFLGACFENFKIKKHKLIIFIISMSISIKNDLTHLQVYLK